MVLGLRAAAAGTLPVKGHTVIRFLTASYVSPPARMV